MCKILKKQGKKLNYLKAKFLLKIMRPYRFWRGEIQSSYSTIARRCSEKMEVDKTMK